MIAYSRIKEQWKFNFSLLTLVVDWVVLLYICIPFTVLAIFLYRDFYLSITSSLFIHIPVFYLIFVLLLASALLSFRTFLLQADQLFFIQQKGQLKRLKVIGFIYSICLHLLKITVFILLCSPILIQIHFFSFADLVALTFLCIGVGFARAIINLYVTKRWLGYVLYFILCLIGTAFVYLPSIVVISSMVVVISATVAFYYKYVCCSSKNFARLVTLDAQAYYKWQSVVFLSNQDFNYLNEKQIKKIHLLGWKNSKRIFKKKELFFLETFLKTFVRRKQFYGPATMYLSMGIAAMFIFPLWVKLLTIVFMVLISSSIVGASFRYLSSQAFINLYFKDDNLFNQMAKQVKIFSNVGTFVFFSLLFILTV